jgi:hypothetical protein
MTAKEHYDTHLAKVYSWMMGDFSCFLEYFPDRVMVHDIILERTGCEWVQKISSYLKLKISVDSFKNTLEQNQITIVHENTIGGMIFIIGQKLTRS